MYDDFCYRCKELDIRVLQLDELKDYVEELSDKPDLRPIELKELEE